MPQQKSTARALFEAMALTALAAGLFVVMLGRVIIVTGISMRPGLENGDIVFAERLSAFWRPPSCKDMVCFKTPGMPGILIKRIVAIPGDSVSIAEGTLIINGIRQEEPYINGPMGGWNRLDPQVVAEGRYFVLGDNRDQSVDSRSFGSIEQGAFGGRVVFRLWPLERFGPIAAMGASE